MTTQQINAVQRYRVGYSCDEWGMRSSTPTCLPAPDGAWVRFSDMQALQANYNAAWVEIKSLQAQLAAIGAARVELLRRDHFPGSKEMVPVGWAISYDGKTPYALWHDTEELLNLEVKRQGGTTCKMKLYARIEK